MLESLDAAAVRRWCAGGLAGLRLHQQEIDDLNVYPVPDGDTGTNLVLTLTAGERALAGETESGHGHGDALRVLARGALLGARGNSGVIISQILRGLADALADAAEVRGRALAEALRVAATAAYQAVVEPVEGTILTVVSAAAKGAVAAGSDDLATVARAATAAAARALARTPQQLPALARAGVVDAGGRGLVVLLQALVEVVTGPPAGVDPAEPPPVDGGAPGGYVPPGGPAAGDGGLSRYAYEVQYLLEADGGAVTGLKRALSGLGDSLVVVGTGVRQDEMPTWNVHIHVDDIGAAIEAGMAAGRPYRISVTPLVHRLPVSRGDRKDAAAPAVGASGAGGSVVGSSRVGASGVGMPAGGAPGAGAGGSGTGGPGGAMPATAEPTRVGSGADRFGGAMAAVAEPGHAGSGADRSGTVRPPAAREPGTAKPGPVEPAGPEPGADAPGAGADATADPDARATVVVASGGGLAALFRAEGATVVGGNPSPEELLAGIWSTRAGQVVVLPNDGDTRAVAAVAAREARACGVRVRVVPTRSPVQALAALAVRDPARRFDDDAITMAEAAGACRYGEACYASREALTVAGRCRPGDVLGLVDGEVHVIGAELEQSCRDLLDRMLGGGGELVTLVMGAEAPTDLESKLRAHLTRRWPFVEVQSYDGGQPFYPLLVGVE